MKNNIPSYFEKVTIQNPVDQVIEQFHTLIINQTLKPKDRLPSEKKLETLMGVPRGVISKSINMMETYGIVEVIPQSGTYIADICVEALDGLMTNIISLKVNDLDHISEVRMILEVFAIEKVVENASNADIAELEKIHYKMRKHMDASSAKFDSDLVFHLKIAEFSQNPVLKSILTRLIVDMINVLNTHFSSLETEASSIRLKQAIKEHDEILQQLKNRNKEGAIKAIKAHFMKSKEFRDQIY